MHEKLDRTDTCWKTWLCGVVECPKGEREEPRLGSEVTQGYICSSPAAADHRSGRGCIQPDGEFRMREKAVKTCGVCLAPNDKRFLKLALGDERSTLSEASKHCQLGGETGLNRLQRRKIGVFNSKTMC
jgi:hypothetical protein